MSLFAKKSSFFLLIVALKLVEIATVNPLRAQEPPAAPPDVLIFTDGERLVGHLIRSAGGSVTFHSDMVGDVTVEWSKIQEIHSARRFAVIEKGVKLHREADAAGVPQGTIAVTGPTITVNPGAGQTAQTVQVGNTGYIVEAPYFQSIVMHNPGFLEDWNGTVTGGASLLDATQQNRTLFGSISLVRAIPPETWIAARNRTIVDFSASDGVLTQPNTPKVKTNIYHADAERDQYFSSRVYGFGQVGYDHNYSQGLSLQQVYGGGIGWTVIDAADQTFDLKGGVNYERQNFQTVASRSLAGSTFAEHYNRKLSHGIVFNEVLSLVPAWNDTHAYWASFNTNVTMPIYKRFSLTAGVIDTYLNDPPPGFKKNSFQFTSGLTYSLR